jgi:FkbH-like protein
MDTFLFVDDQGFEREEVQHAWSEVRTLDPAEYQNDYLSLVERPELIPRFITEDSGKRRLMYLQESERQQAEESFEGTKDSFLQTLDLKFGIFPADETDLKRAEELTVRTNQLNATGKTYSYEELRDYMRDDNHELLVCRLEDKYGDYGRIGIALLEKREAELHIKLLLMSCRVMARGVGTVMLTYLKQRAAQENVRLTADFVDTGRNRMMYVTFKFAGFKEMDEGGDGMPFLVCDPVGESAYPPYIEIEFTR